MYFCQAFESKSRENGNEIIFKLSDEVSFDRFSCHLPITHRGNRNILSINDQFSKFTQLSAVPDRTAVTSTKCVFDSLLKFGITVIFRP